MMEKEKEVAFCSDLFAFCTNWMRLFLVLFWTILRVGSGFHVAYDSALAGACLTTAKTLLKHPLDTMTVRLQASPPPPPGASMKDRVMRYREALLGENPMRGAVPSLVSSAPCAAVFFLVKDTSRQLVPQSPVTNTLLSILLASVPYWVLRTPFETAKTKLQAGSETSAAPLANVLPNLAYAYPADVVKFLVYDNTVDVLLPAATAGSIATALSQAVTTPLDGIRNRMALRDGGNYFEVAKELVEEGGVLEGLTPRVLKAAVSGALQFWVYHEVLAKLNS